MGYNEVISLVVHLGGNHMSLVTVQPARLAALARTPGISDTVTIGGMPAATAFSDGLVSCSGPAQPVAADPRGD